MRWHRELTPTALLPHSAGRCEMRQARLRAGTVEVVSVHLLVATIVHHPEDARILHRQVRALLDAGHAVTYLAPFGQCGAEPRFGVTPVDVPRARGRQRTGALRAARSKLKQHAADADLILLHDPELLLALPAWGRKTPRPPVVWDVHEDTAATLRTKPWLPAAARPVLHPSVRATERVAEHRINLLLAERGYRDRFAGEHPVVPNSTYVPAQVRPPGDSRVVYLGHLSGDRGAGDLVAAARMLANSGIGVELVGPADDAVSPQLRQAHDQGLLHWHGFLPQDRALQLLGGALAGLSLLHDRTNHRLSRPTKIVEYMAHGLPVISTPLPYAVDTIVPANCGTIVPYRAPDAVAKAVLWLRDNPELRERMGMRGHVNARTHYHWPDHARTFVSQIESWARGGPTLNFAGTPEAATVHLNV